jgi:predicted acetyltransferase
MTTDDFEQVSYVESKAFYNTPSPERVQLMRELVPPHWTVVATVDGKVVATVRAMPQLRRFHGSLMKFGAVGPVSCLAPYRRRGIVGKLLTLALERMRERGQVLSGLHTPHDELYRRYGWERAEGKSGYVMEPKQVRFRFRPSGGRTEPGNVEDWQRLDRIYQDKVRDANGAFTRSEPYWKYGVLTQFGDKDSKENDIVVWVDEQGRDQGYAVYTNQNLVPRGHWIPQQVFVRDFEALTPDAYVGLFEHLLTHDLAERITGEMHPNDPLRFVVQDPSMAKSQDALGAMLRIVDLERAFEQRPFVGTRAASLTVQVDDHLDWNKGVWRIEGAEGQMRAERTDAAPDVELDRTVLAALFSGFLKPKVGAATGFFRLNRPEVLPEMEQLFSVLDAPYCPDYY